jgi:hypothetical protein
MIYVDALAQWGKALGYRGEHAEQAERVGARNDHQWCHLFADETDSAELHVFAARLGMHREWFQGDHYDLTPAKRAKAVKLGAKEVTREESVRIWRGQRRKPKQMELFK